MLWCQGGIDLTCGISYARVYQVRYLMPKHSAETDLAWLHNCAEASMGVQSSFEPIRYAIMSGGASKTSVGDSMSDSRIKAASRYRAIMNRLKKISRTYQSILAAAYQPRQWSANLENAFGDVSYDRDGTKRANNRRIGVIVFCKTANDFFEADLPGADDSAFFVWIEQVAHSGDQQRISLIRDEANRLLEQAHRQYDGVTI